MRNNFLLDKGKKQFPMEIHFYIFRGQISNDLKVNILLDALDPYFEYLIENSIINIKINLQITSTVSELQSLEDKNNRELAIIIQMEIKI